MLSLDVAVKQIQRILTDQKYYQQYFSWTAVRAGGNDGF
jgi:hypothetical protein